MAWPRTGSQVHIPRGGTGANKGKVKFEQSHVQNSKWNAVERLKKQKAKEAKRAAKKAADAAKKARR